MAQNLPKRLLALGNGVWLDEIRTEGQQPIKDIPGGSVTFATLGARLFVPEDPTAIGLIFNAGHDFPESVIDSFRDWSVDLQVRYIHNKPSSRGIVYYDEGNANRKSFERLTEPLPMLVQDLQPMLLLSKAFTFFGTAEYIEQQVKDSLSLRSAGDIKRPFVVWEPHARSCRPDTLSAHQAAAEAVDVFSPNHEELHSFFESSAEGFDRAAVEREAKVFVKTGIGRNDTGCIVVRAAGHGCLVLATDSAPIWMPSYHFPDSDKVVDPTGAGNAFLGAFAIGYQNTKNYVEAAMYGMVAASFTIEQVGLPTRTDSGDMESWNGESVQQRLQAYSDRVYSQWEVEGTARVSA